jgi:hypothetical protein
MTTAVSRSGISGIRGKANAVLATIFDLPLKRISGKDENAPIVFAVVVELVVSRHNIKGTAAQSCIEVIDVRRDLYPAASEGGAELVIELDDFLAVVGAR